MSGRARLIVGMLLAAGIIAALVGANSCSSLGGQSIRRGTPQCIVVPPAPEKIPADPFTDSGDNDGFTPKQRVEFITKCVASTIGIQGRRYSYKKGYSFVSGSGVMISKTQALTAAHVLEGTVDRYVSLRRVVFGSKLDIGILRFEKVDVIVRETETDVALLNVHVPPELAVPMKIAQNWRPQKGEIVWQFGFRTGWARGRVVKVMPHSPLTNVGGEVYVNSKIQPGDSGGPVVNTRGELVGLNLHADSEKGQQFFVHIDVTLKALGMAASH